MTPQEKRIALAKLSDIVTDLHAAAMREDSEKALVITLIYRLVMVSEILQQMLQDPGRP